MVSHYVLLSSEWEAVGHGLETSWTSFGSRFGVWIFGALMAYVVVRGLVRASRYRAAEALDEADRTALKERVAQAESQTSGEIVVVVVEASDNHPDAPWKAAAATLFLGSLLLGGLAHSVGSTSLGSLGFVAVQVAVAGLGYLLAFWLQDFRRCFVSEGRATEVTEEQALQELQRLDLTAQPERTAVLLFVSVFEQRVVILADTRAHEAVGEDAWIQADEAVLQALRAKGRPAKSLRQSLHQALSQGIDAIGSVLADALPAEAGGTNALKDDVEIRRR